MPYISEEERLGLSHRIDGLSQHIITRGEMNYVITALLHQWIQFTSKELSYSVINDAIGILECAKLELYRKIASPYEDKKLEENGGVSELDK